MKNLKRLTTKDMKLSIEQMEEENLHLDASIEVWIDGKLYYVTEIGHFHVIPRC